MALWDCTATVQLSPVPCVVVTVQDIGATTGGYQLMRTDTASGEQVEVRVPAYTDYTTAPTTNTVYYDYEALQGHTYTYKIGPGAASASLVFPDVGAWLITPFNPSVSVPLRFARGGFPSWARPAVVNSVTPIGATRPYSVSFTRQDPSGQVTVLSATHDEHAALVVALREPGPKLFSWPMARWMAVDTDWAMISDVQDVPSPVYVSESWQTTLTLVPTDRPAVVPVSTVKPMGSLTITQSLGVTVTDALTRTLT